MEISQEDREFYAAYIRANSGHYPYDSPAEVDAPPRFGATEYAEDWS